MKLQVKQSSLFSEQVESPGFEPRIVCWVVKGTPFQIDLKVTPKPKISLANAQVQLNLLVEDSKVPVDVGYPALTWTCAVNSRDASEINCQVRVGVLSTQVSKACMIIHATVSIDGQKTLEAMSNPIKVVSKPEQVRRKRKEANQEPELEGSKKRARSEDVLVELRQIYQVLQSNTTQLRKMVETRQHQEQQFMIQQQPEQNQIMMETNSNQIYYSDDMHDSNETHDSNEMHDSNEPFDAKPTMNQNVDSTFNYDQQIVDNDDFSMEDDSSIAPSLSDTLSETFDFDANFNQNQPNRRVYESPLDALERVLKSFANMTYEQQAALTHSPMIQKLREIISSVELPSAPEAYY